MCLAPMFILGIIPHIVWLLLPVMISMPVYLGFPLVFWFMTVMSLGDAANVYYTVKEVPKGAMVFNHGLLRSFYRIVER